MRGDGEPGTGQRRRARPVVGFVVTVVLAACGPADDAGRAEAVVRDSAGITIVRHEAFEAEGLDRWNIRPVLTVDGSATGASAEFGFVVDAEFDGSRLWVLDGPAATVRVFDASGAVAGTIGGPGEGPGELSTFASSLLLASDTLSITDWGQGRLHHFDVDGSFLGSVVIPTGGTRSWWRSGADGRVYARTLERFVDSEGRWRGHDRLVRANRSGQLADTLMVFSYSETDLGGPGRPALPLVVNAPTWDVSTDGRIAWTSLEDERVYVHDPAGRLERIIEVEDWQGRPPSDADRVALLRSMGDKLVSLGGSREAVAELGARLPERLPAVTSLQAGPHGTILVQRLGSTRDAHPMSLNSPDPPIGWGGALWEVFESDGARAGYFELPARTRVTRVTDEHIVGVVHDELGRDRVVVWGFEPR